MWMQEMESTLQEELDVLQSIYMDEISVNGPADRPDEIMVKLQPYTADEKEQKYVCMQLLIRISPKYPNEKPSIEIKSPRGISDAQLDSILVNLNALTSQKIGHAVLFDLIEYAKECLTDNNRPECDCAICMDHFEAEDEFVRTECYHFFHSTCMARYVKMDLETKSEDDLTEDKSKKDNNLIQCPICRAEIRRDQLKLEDVTPESATTEKVDFQPSKEFLLWREEMKEVFKRQQKRGGIIDIEAEKNKFLIQTKVTKGNEDSSTPEQGLSQLPTEQDIDRQKNVAVKQNRGGGLSPKIVRNSHFDNNKNYSHRRCEDRKEYFAANESTNRRGGRRGYNDRNERDKFRDNWRGRNQDRPQAENNRFSNDNDKQSISSENKDRQTREDIAVKRRDDVRVKQPDRTKRNLYFQADRGNRSSENNQRINDGGSRSPDICDGRNETKSYDDQMGAERQRFERQPGFDKKGKDHTRTAKKQVVESYAGERTRRGDKEIKIDDEDVRIDAMNGREKQIDDTDSSRHKNSRGDIRENRSELDFYEDKGKEGRNLDSLLPSEKDIMLYSKGKEEKDDQNSQCYIQKHDKDPKLRDDQKIQNKSEGYYDFCNDSQKSQRSTTRKAGTFDEKRKTYERKKLEKGSRSYDQRKDSDYFNAAALPGDDQSRGGNIDTQEVDRESTSQKNGSRSQQHRLSKNSHFRGEPKEKLIPQDTQITNNQKTRQKFKSKSTENLDSKTADGADLYARHKGPQKGPEKGPENPQFERRFQSGFKTASSSRTDGYPAHDKDQRNFGNRSRRKKTERNSAKNLESESAFSNSKENSNIERDSPSTASNTGPLKTESSNLNDLDRQIVKSNKDIVLRDKKLSKPPPGFKPL